MSDFSTTRLSELRKLAELRDSGLLTSDEFESEKTRLMNMTEELRSDVPSSLYTPGSHQADTLSGAIPAISAPSGRSVTQILLLIVRIYFAAMTLGITELVLFVIRKVRTSKPKVD